MLNPGRCHANARSHSHPTLFGLDLSTQVTVASNLVGQLAEHIDHVGTAHVVSHAHRFNEQVSGWRCPLGFEFVEAG